MLLDPYLHPRAPQAHAQAQAPHASALALHGYLPTAAKYTGSGGGRDHRKALEWRKGTSGNRQPPFHHPCCCPSTFEGLLGQRAPSQRMLNEMSAIPLNWYAPNTLQVQTHEARLITCAKPRDEQPASKQRWKIDIIRRYLEESWSAGLLPNGRTHSKGQRCVLQRRLTSGLQQQLV